MALDFTRFSSALLLVGALFATGCPSVDDTDDTDGNATPVFIDAAIVGTWVSTGGDISPLFAGLNIVELNATFNDDGTYTATSEDSGGTVSTFTGTYSVDDSAEPASIALVQESPYGAGVTGIWQIEGDGSLTYEVVQTTPDIGFVAPTPATGFGSTSGPGINAGDNVQTYR
jgi:hypothetical protein